MAADQRDRLRENGMILYQVSVPVPTQRSCAVGKKSQFQFPVSRYQFHLLYQFIVLLSNSEFCGSVVRPLLRLQVAIPRSSSQFQHNVSAR